MKKFVAVVLFAALMIPTPALAAGGFEIQHRCTLDSGREKFVVLNYEPKSVTLRVKTAFDNKRVEVGPQAGETVKARVSQGNYPVAKLYYKGDVVDKVRAHYNPC